MSLRPGTEAELADAIRAAHADRRTLEVRGGGTRAGLGGPVEADETLETGGLAGITLHEPGALTLVVRAGTPLAEVNAALEAENQMLPFEPMTFAAIGDAAVDAGAAGAGGAGGAGASTIGGVVATNASGPRRLQAGACRDSMIGVRFVDGRGEPIKNGGRVMKNVTGYDLVKLLAGSHGTLGIVTEVGFKVLPAPEATATVAVHGLDAPAAIRAMSAALGSPYDVSGAAHLPRGREGADGGASDATGDDRATTLVRVHGFAGSVQYRAERLRELLGAHGEVTVDDVPDSTAATWRAVRDVEPLGAVDGDLWRVSVRPSDGGDVVRRLGDADASLAHLLDWGGGLVWVRTAPGTDVRASLAGLRGHSTLVHASAATRARLGAFEPEAAPVARLSAGLRERFDPAGILNPGRMAAPVRTRAPARESAPA